MAALFGTGLGIKGACLRRMVAVRSLAKAVELG